MTSALFAGITTIDIAYLVDSYPAEDSKTQAIDQFTGAGGPAANAAVTYSILSGGGASLLTALGSHPLTQIARADLQAHNVSTIDVISGQPQQPPISSVVVASNSRSRTVVSLDASRITVPDSTAFGDALETTMNVVLIDGHYGNVSMEIAKRARARGVPVVLDAGRWKEVHRDLLPLVDIAICSSAFSPPDLMSEDPSSVLQYLADSGPKMAAVTRGGDSIMFAGPEAAGDIPVESGGQVIDTLGAGDILHGAFCYFYGAAELPFEEALKKAAGVATFSTRYFGTRVWTRHWAAR